MSLTEENNVCPTLRVLLNLPSIIFSPTCSCCPFRGVGKNLTEHIKRALKINNQILAENF